MTIAACTWVGWWQFNSISTQQTIQTEQTMLAHAESYVRSVASVESLHIKALFEQRLKVAATMASIATEIAQNTRPDKRIQLSDFLKLLMKENPEYFGSYYAFEPNALDGRDSEYLGMPGQDENGRFQPYGTRENKQVTVVSLLALEDQTRDNNGVRAGEYYLCSKELIRRCTIGPYIYPVDGKDTLLASVSAPIVSNGQLIGVAGLDISAEFLQTLTAKLSKSVYDGTGTLILLSSAGVIAGHSTQEKLVGSNIRSLQKDEQQIISDSINKKDVAIEQTDTVFTLAMPFYIDEETVPWVMYISIPKAKVLEHAYKQQEFMLVAKQNFAETLILVGALLAGLGIGTVWLVSKNSIAPLKQMTTMISQIAEGDGDLTKTLTITRYDEVGELAAHVNTFIQRLQTMISSLVVVGEQVGQLSTQSNEIGKLTDGQVMHQQALLEQVVTAITEMSATAQEVARSAAHAADAVKQAEVATSNGNTVVKQTVNAVSTVKESSEQARTSMQQLESNSKEIFSILSVIQGIAEQTNLLALNAAIEAARAGEQGRGFAVVADEVRALAGRTRTATEEIGVMLNHLQEGSRKAAAMMQSSNERVQETVQSALQAEQAITQIQQAIAQISQMNFQIAAATEEQSLVCDDINHNIAKIAAVATDTAKSASSLRLLGEEQDKTANALKRQLGQFKV